MLLHLHSSDNHIAYLFIHFTVNSYFPRLFSSTFLYFYFYCPFFVSLFQPIVFLIPCKINRKSAKSETFLLALFGGGIKNMPKPKTPTGEKNLISQRLIELRRQHNLSQRDLARQLQLHGYDMDKNVITRIETNKRYVTDVELKALTEIFNISYEYLIEGKEEKS